MSAQPKTETTTPATGLPADVQREILRAINGIQFGSVEIVIHDSRVVQIEAREKIRLPGDTTRRP